MPDATDDKRLRLRFAATCRVCGEELPAKVEAVYERTARTVRCLVHDEVPTDDAPSPPQVVSEQAVEVGTAGASARREFERRRIRREERVRSRHPRLGGLMLAVSEPPQTTRAWDVGALGEERLGAGLDQRAGEAVRLLHDRRIPASRANIDHLAVTASGVFVIDAKRYRGRPRLQVDGGLIRSRVERLVVGSRDCTTLVDGVLKQVEIVRAALGGRSEEVPVHGVLCFVEADWPLIGGAFTTRGVHALWPKKLYARLPLPGPLDIDTISAVHRTLAHALPPA